MKFTNGDFLDQLEKLQQEVGAILQEIRSYPNGLFLSFWSKSSGISAWYVDLNPKAPVFLKAPDGLQPSLKAKTSPLELFLKAHFKNRVLLNIQWESRWGRVLNLEFPESRGLQLRLFSHGTNAIATAEEKSIAFRRPVELVPIEWMEQAPRIRDSSDQDLWSLHFNSGSSSGGKKVSKDDDVERLQRAIQKIRASTDANQEEKWKNLGLQLQSGTSVELPYPEFGLSENIQKCFEKAKQEKQKQAGREKRLKELQDELQALQSGVAVRPAKKNSEVDLFTAGKSKGQATHLSSGHKIYFGKSAADNLKLLRAGAPSDLWLHVKDLPGSHAVLKKNKKEKLPDSLLKEAGRCLLEHQFRNKLEKYKGQKFEVLCTELRYVKPIKGDKLGRVTHTHASTLIVQL